MPRHIVLLLILFPTIFAVALIGIIVFDDDPTLKNVIIHGGGWFVQAILVFYAVFWFVKRFLSDKLWIAYVIDGIFILAWFVFFWDKDLFILTNAMYLRWPCYFMVMLLGASAYRLEKNKNETDMRNRLALPFCLLLALLLFYYGYQLVENRLPILNKVQIVLFPTLMGIIWIIYSICSNSSVQKVYRSKYVYWPVYYISACCLEIYLSQGWCFGFGRQLIKYFPLNVIATFILVFVVAYLVKVFSNFLSQTFKTEKYDWKGMVKL